MTNYKASTNTHVQYTYKTKNQKKRSTKQTLHTSNNKENQVNLNDESAAGFSSDDDDDDDDINNNNKHFNICKETGRQLDKKHWYEHVPKSAETSPGGKVTILWNQQVQIHRTIPNNKPDIIIVVMKREHVC